jgi:hypothetical protein
MLKTKDIEVDEGLTVTLKVLPATDASDVMIRLTRALGPAAAALTDSLEGSELSTKGLPEAVRLLFAGITPSEFRELREMLFREATFLRAETSEEKGATGLLLGKISGGSKLTNFDILFSGKLGKMFPLLWEALALNFGFSDAASLNVEGLKERVAAKVTAYLSTASGSIGKLKSVGPATDL